VKAELMPDRSIVQWQELQARIERMRQADDDAPVYVRLRDGGRLMELRNDVPATRSECPVDRPCGRVRCRWNLWRVDSQARAGRPHAGRRPPTTLRAGWLETPTPPSCARDIIERGEASVDEIAQALGMDRTNVWLIWQRPHVRKAFERLREMLGSDE
jgi:hypothetical protein